MIRREWMNPKGLDFENDYEKAFFHKHFAPYLYIEDVVKGKEVLELGCGAGYGIDYISKNAKRIVTVDIDLESIEHAKQNTDAKNIEYIHQDILDGLPFGNATFDVVISFQVIEHFNSKNVHYYLQEISRVLKPGGRAYLTTPNRDTRLLPLQKPVNKYHPLEYSYASLSRLIKQYFPSHEVLTLRSDEAIEQIFNTRKNMKPFHVYVLKPIRRNIVKISSFLKISALSRFLDNRSRYTRPYHTLNIGDINSNNFKFEKQDYRKGMDFLLICTKSI
jgi:SAM-dependent methyltransferase